MLSPQILPGFLQRPLNQLQLLPTPCNSPHRAFQSTMSPMLLPGLKSRLGSPELCADLRLLSLLPCPLLPRPALALAQVFLLPVSSHCPARVRRPHRALDPLCCHCLGAWAGSVTASCQSGIQLCPYVVLGQMNDSTAALSTSRHPLCGPRATSWTGSSSPPELLPQHTAPTLCTSHRHQGLGFAPLVSPQCPLLSPALW